MNHIWMAESTECSTYSDNLTKFPHLKEAAAAASEWAKLSTEVREFSIVLLKTISILDLCHLNDLIYLFSPKQMIDALEYYFYFFYRFQDVNKLKELVLSIVGAGKV